MIFHSIERLRPPTLRGRLCSARVLCSSRLVLATLAIVVTLPACVKTAECDETAPCQTDGEVCYQYECRPTCAQDDACAAGETCTPCQKNQYSTNYCHGEQGMACVAQ